MRARLLIGLLCMLAPLFSAFAKAPHFNEAFYCLGDAKQSTTLRLQVADTEPRQRHGLMFRRELKPFDGMIFLFGRERIPTMWMKNTFLPLDMLFLDKNGKLVQIFYDTVPHSEALITPDEPVTTVIELEAGRAEKEGFEKGDQLLLGTCPDLP